MPKRPRLPLLVALCALLGAPAFASPRVRTIPLDEIKPGMTGYGLTVFEGTKPERFDVRVVGVLRNFLPKQDIILIRSEDPRLLHSGIVAGMSGSPIYLDGGRLAGALSYGWSFSKDPLAGVTPIANMLRERERPLRGREHTPVSEARNDDLFTPRKSVDEALADRAAEPGGSPALRSRGAWPMFMDHYPLPALPPDAASTQLVRASVPLALA